MKNVFYLNYSEVGNKIICPNCGTKHRFNKPKKYQNGTLVRFNCAVEFFPTKGCGSEFIIKIDNIT